MEMIEHNGRRYQVPLATWGLLLRTLACVLSRLKILDASALIPFGLAMYCLRGGLARVRDWLKRLWGPTKSEYEYGEMQGMPSDASILRVSSVES